MKTHFGIAVMMLIGMTTLLSCAKEESGPRVFTGSGDISEVLETYRGLLGENNGGKVGSQGNGRREINWDGVPDEFASPNYLPRNFFNTDVNNRARGADYTTPGLGTQVSADQQNSYGALPSFGNINQAYISAFPAFSQERVFSPIGSNIVDFSFFIPGTETPAVVRGFGAIYIDVDRDENTAFEYFDVNGNSLGKYGTPALNNGHVFLGVLFDEPIVRRVRIEYGNSNLGPNESNTVDVAVMDDFIYGEPVLPE